jgi:serine protease
MASPHVAGAVALMKVVNPNLTPVDINNIISSGKITTDIDLLGKDVKTGHGLLNVLLAVEEASKFTAGSNIKDSINMSPTQLNYGFTTNDLSVTLTKVGDGNLTITGVYADQTDGFLVKEPTASGLAFGTYTFSIEREKFKVGSYQNTFYFGLSNGSYPTIKATFSVGDERSTPDLGVAYILLIDEASGDVMQSKTIDISSGLADYKFDNVDSSKTYQLKVGSDIDNDNIIGQWGEVYDSMPPYNDPNSKSFTLTQNETGVNFSLTPISAISFGSLNSEQTSVNLETFPGN